MILLSKSYPNEQASNRVIQIKPIHNLHREEAEETNFDSSSLIDEVEHLKQEIAKQNAELQNLEEKKEALIQETQAVIKREQDSWQEEKEKLQEEARVEAYAEGLEKGKLEAQATYEQVLEQANAIIDVAKEEYHRVLDESEETIIDLSIYMAEKILKEQIERKPEHFINIVKGAISEIKDQSSITIFLHPHNYKAVMEEKSALETLLNGDTKLSIFVDHKLAENSCLIEHPLGQVDATVDTQLNEIRNVLINVAKEKAKWN